MSDWRNALDEQLDMYRWWGSRAGRDTAQSFGVSMQRVEIEVRGRETMRDITESIDGTERMKLLHADTFAVEDEMMTLVEAAAESFSPEKFEPSDLLAPIGWLTIPRPMFMTDRHGKRLSFAALSWSPLLVRDPRGQDAEGVHLALYSRLQDVVDGVDDYAPQDTREALDQARSAFGPYLLCHLTSWMFGMELPEHAAASAQGVSYEARDTGAEIVPTDIEGYGSWWRPVQSLFRLMQQTIVDRDEEIPPRAARRRAQKIRPDSDPYITVIRLRRPKNHQPGEERDVEWSKRWIVSGHWRNQYMPSTQTHRQIWISPYVKGPEGAPLVVRKRRAFEFAR